LKAVVTAGVYSVARAQATIDVLEELPSLPLALLGLDTDNDRALGNVCKVRCATATSSTHSFSNSCFRLKVRICLTRSRARLAAWIIVSMSERIPLP
jgi:hypothetical protein